MDVTFYYGLKMFPFGLYPSPKFTFSGGRGYVSRL